MGGTVPVRQAYSSAYAPVVSSYPVVSHYPAYAPAPTSAYGQVTYSHPTGYLASRAPAYGDLGERDGYSSYAVQGYAPYYTHGYTIKYVTPSGEVRYYPVNYPHPSYY